MFRKVVFVFIFSVVACVAFAEPVKNPLDIAGAGVLVSTSSYRGVEAKIIPVPFLRVEYKDFYIKGIEAGYHFLKTDDWTLTAVMVPRFMGYDSDDSAALNGMQDRRSSLDAGLKAQYALPWGGTTLTVKALTDVLARNKGSEYELALGRIFKGNIWRLTSSAGLRYLNEEMADYYYGVRDVEAVAGRPAYEPRGSVDPFANLTFMCGISKKLVVVTMLGVDLLGKEIRKSPIVDENYVLSAALGLTYKF